MDIGPAFWQDDPHMKTTLSQALTELRTIIAAHPIYGARFTPEWLIEHTEPAGFSALSFGHRIGGITLRWEQAWGADIRLEVVFTKETIPAKGNREAHTLIQMRTDLGWSATSRNVASALTAITLYTQVTQLAALIESALDGQTLIEEPAAMPTATLAAP